jgi:hypothetical protein
VKGIVLKAREDGGTLIGVEHSKLPGASGQIELESQMQ